MKKVKVYNLKTRKRSYLVVGTSIQDVKDYVDENKKNLDLTFDMSGYYSVNLNKDVWVNWYDMCDDVIDVVNLTDKNKLNVMPEFTTCNAQFALIENKSLNINMQ